MYNIVCGGWDSPERAICGCGVVVFPNLKGRLFS